MGNMNFALILALEHHLFLSSVFWVSGVYNLGRHQVVLLQGST